MMGVYFAPPALALRAPDNPRGHWERRDVMAVNNQLLRLQGCEWWKMAGWRFDAADKVPEALQEQMRQVVMELDNHQPWFVKDPRLCLTLPAWKKLLKAPVAVLVYRDPQEIALSLKTRSKLPPEYSLALWEYHAVGALNATRGMPRVHVAHEHLLARPLQACEALYAELIAAGVQGLAMPSRSEIEAFIDPALYRSRSPTAPLFTLSEAQKKLVGMLKGEMVQNHSMRISDPSAHMIKNSA